MLAMIQYLLHLLDITISILGFSLSFSFPNPVVYVSAEYDKKSVQYVIQMFCVINNEDAFDSLTQNTINVANTCFVKDKIHI